MSSPDKHTREAAQLKYGLLAARAAQALRKAEAEEPLTDDDRRILGKAEAFLKEVAEGASLLATGETVGGGAVSSVEALGYALQPIESIGLADDRQVTEILQGIAKAVHEATMPLVDPATAHVDVARGFFESLYNSFLGSIEYSRQQPVRRGLAALATSC